MTRAQAPSLLQADLVALAKPLKLGGTLSSILKKFLCLYAGPDDKTSDWIPVALSTFFKTELRFLDLSV